MNNKIRLILLILVLFVSMTACSHAVSETVADDGPLLGMGVPIQLKSITVDIPGNDSFVALGQTIQLAAKTDPEQAGQTAFSWTIEAGPASIDPASGLVTITGYGKILARASAGDGSGVVGDAVLVGVPAAPDYHIDYDLARTREIVPAAHEYSADGGSTWIKGNDVSLPLQIGRQILLRIAASGSVYAGKTQTLLVEQPAPAAAPQFSIDYFIDQGCCIRLASAE